MGRHSVVGTATGYELSEDRFPVEARFSAPVQNDPGAHPAGSLPGSKAAGAWRGVEHPHPSVATVNERVELYLYRAFVVRFRVNFASCRLK